MACSRWLESRRFSAVRSHGRTAFPARLKWPSSARISGATRRCGALGVVAQEVRHREAALGQLALLNSSPFRGEIQSRNMPGVHAKALSRILLRMNERGSCLGVATCSECKGLNNAQVAKRLAGNLNDCTRVPASNRYLKTLLSTFGSFQAKARASRVSAGRETRVRPLSEVKMMMRCSGATH
jgi:hypothetical protein